MATEGKDVGYDSDNEDNDEGSSSEDNDEELLFDSRLLRKENPELPNTGLNFARRFGFRCKN